MAVRVPSELHVALEAESFLATAGLEQAAHEAGLTLVRPGNPAVASLRTEGAGHPHPDVDVCTDGSRVTVAFGIAPSDELWTALGRLLQSLFSKDQTGTRHS
jgi:hypothetical protein